MNQADNINSPNENPDVSSEAVQQLQPIFCGECGASVPLADSEQTSCIYCGARVEIPDKYRRGQEAKNKLLQIRKNAEKFLEKIGRRPRFYEIWISRIPSWAFLMIMLFFIVTGFSTTIFSLEYSISKMIGTSIRALVSEFAWYTGYTAIFSVFMILVLSVFFLTRRRVFVTRRLMSVLAAGAPHKPGGPATCRRCGAPFQVAANDLAAACSYCATENFLHVPTEWLSATRKLTVHSGRNVFWAEREYERELNSSRQSFYGQIRLYGIFLVLLGGLYLAGDSSRVFIWKEMVSSPNRAFIGRTKDSPVPVLGQPFQIHGIYTRYRGEKGFTFRIAMQKGEQLNFTLVDVPSMRVRCNGRFSKKMISLNQNKSTAFKPETGGWYELILLVPNNLPEGMKTATILIDLQN